MESLQGATKYMFTSLIAVLIGFCLDLIVGDPVYAWHPVRIIGNMIAALENRVRDSFPKSKKGELLAGMILVICVLLLTLAIPYIILYLAYQISVVMGVLMESIFCYQILATRSLKDESMKVFEKLKQNDLKEARKAVSMIVGRDTNELNEVGIVKATVETIAENTSDGCIAPLIYLVIGGPVLGFCYKAINTMDSMIGYKNEKYLYYGRIAARLDDVVNFIPARISAMLMLFATLFNSDFNTANSWKIYNRDKYKHASPNSAHTEAVMAGALQVELAGNAIYFGKEYQKPTIGESKRPVEMMDIVRANRLLYMTSVSGLILFLILKWICIWIVTN